MQEMLFISRTFKKDLRGNTIHGTNWQAEKIFLCSGLPSNVILFHGSEISAENESSSNETLIMQFFFANRYQ